jgi:hypothetical protein
MLAHRMLDELLKLLVELSGVVIQRRHMCFVGHVLGIVRHSANKRIEPIVLSKRPLRVNHARRMLEEAVKGTSFPISELRAVEVLLDHRRTYYETMLVHDRFEHVDDPVLFGHAAPVSILYTTIIGVLLDGTDHQLREHPTTVVGLAQNQLDVVLLGSPHERVERLIIIAAKEPAAGDQEHPAVKELKDRVRSFILATT